MSAKGVICLADVGSDQLKKRGNGLVLRRRGIWRGASRRRSGTGTKKAGGRVEGSRKDLEHFGFKTLCWKCREV